MGPCWVARTWSDQRERSGLLSGHVGYVVPKTLYTPYSTALQNGNSSAVSFAPLGPQQAPFVPGDGVIGDNTNYDHLFTQNAIKVLPKSDGPAGSQFSLRLYGWAPVNKPDAGNIPTIWIPHFIVELLCTTCNRTGFPGDYLLDNERLCDTISLTQGVVGNIGWGGGFINSTGPGTDLIAWAVINTTGFRFIQFDFQQVDMVGMNCFWARA